MRPILTCANTPNRFYGFISNFSNICFPYLYLLGNWGVEGAMCKILELCDQNPRRNNWSKLGTFDSILQRPHSALIKHNNKQGKGNDSDGDHHVDCANERLKKSKLQAGAAYCRTTQMI